MNINGGGVVGVEEASLGIDILEKISGARCIVNLTPCKLVFLVFLIHATFQSVINIILARRQTSGRNDYVSSMYPSAYGGSAKY
jgi:hypothetical protein